MNRTNVTVTIDVEIRNGSAVIKEARKRARADGVKLARSFSACDAVQYLIDPGSLEGCDVLQSYHNITRV
jgi:hypothetical protein